MTFVLGETFFAGVINWGLRGVLDRVLESALSPGLTTSILSFEAFVLSFWFGIR